MAYTILTAKSELEPMFHGTTLNKVANVNGAFNRAARELLADLDPQETIRQAQLSTPLYDGLFDYTLPTDLKGEKIVDIFPQLNRTPGQQFSQTYLKNFDIRKGSLIQDFTVISTSGNRSLRVSLADQTKSIQLNPVNTIAGNGTWAASGTASALAVDGQYSPNVLSFDVGIGTGILTNSTMDSVDLTNHLSQSLITFDVYIPVATSLTSVAIRFGSDASNYYEKTSITTDYRGNAFVNGWNTIGVLWSGVTTTGTPDYTAIDYLQISYVASVAITAAKLDSIWSRLGTIYNIAYYSQFLFKTTAGVWGETVTDDSDTINLETDSYNIFLFQVALQCTQGIQGANGGYDTAFFKGEYDKGVARYKAMYKSQITKPQQPYYTRTFKGYGRYLGRSMDQR